MSDVKIEDYEFVYAEKVVIAYLEKMLEVSKGYVKEVEKVKDSAINDIMISNNIINLINNMGKIMIDLDEIYVNLDGTAKQFVDTIDELDKFIY